MDSIWDSIRMEMKGFLRGISVDIFNASTLACADLLAQGLSIPVGSTVGSCLVNRVGSLDKGEQEVSVSLKEKRMRLEREREFRRQFGKWPRGLKKMGAPPS